MWSWVKNQKDGLGVTVIGGLILAGVLSLVGVMWALAPEVIPWLLELLATHIFLPLWTLLIFAGGVAVVCWKVLGIRRCFRVLAEKNAHLQAEIEELKNPTYPDLDINQTHVLYWIALLPLVTSKEIAEILSVDCFRIEAISDHLKEIGLLQKTSLLSAPLTLTAKGRQYMSRPEVFAAYKAFRESAGNGEGQLGGM